MHGGSFGLPIRLVDLLSLTSVDGSLEFSAPYGAAVWVSGSGRAEKKVAGKEMTRAVGYWITNK